MSFPAGLTTADMDAPHNLGNALARWCSQPTSPTCGGMAGVRSEARYVTGACRSTRLL